MKCVTLQTRRLEDVVYPWLVATDVVLLVGSKESCSAVPFNLRFAEAIQAQAWKAKKEDLGADNPVTVPRAEIATTDPLRIIPPRGKSDTALVHLCPTTVHGGRLFYEDNEWKGKTVGYRRKRVRRFYQPFPSEGIEVYALGTGPEGEPHAIISMLPGASFRICRSGYRGGLPPERVVSWTGSILRPITPKKYQQDCVGAA